MTNSCGTTAFGTLTNVTYAGIVGEDTKCANPWTLFTAMNGTAQNVSYFGTDIATTNQAAICFMQRNFYNTRVGKEPYFWELPFLPAIAPPLKLFSVLKFKQGFNVYAN